MAAQDPPAYSDRQYFTQLKRQADEALSTTERAASSLVAQVLQVHALLGATVGFLPSESGRRSAQRTLQLGALARTREKARIKHIGCMFAGRGNVDLVEEGANLVRVRSVQCWGESLEFLQAGRGLLS